MPHGGSDMAELLRVSRRPDSATVLSLGEGEAHALLGPADSGKSQWLRAIAGALRLPGMSVQFREREMLAWPQQRRAGAGLLLCTRQPSVFAGSTVMDNLMLAVLARRGGMTQFWRSASRRIVEQAEAEALAQKIGLLDRLDFCAGRLSLAEQRRLDLGLALTAQPRLLLLDQPLAGLSPDEAALMRGLLQRLRSNMSLLIAEASPSLVQGLVDRIWLLDQGQLRNVTEPRVRQGPAAVVPRSLKEPA